MNDKKRYIAGYEVINSIHIGDKEIVLGMNLNDQDGHYYMLTDCERNELFERYTNSVVSEGYLRIQGNDLEKCILHTVRFKKKRI